MPTRLHAVDSFPQLVGPEPRLPSATERRSYPVDQLVGEASQPLTVLDYLGPDVVE